MGGTTSRRRMDDLKRKKKLAAAPVKKSEPVNPDSYDYRTDESLSKQKRAAITKKINADPTFVFTKEMAQAGG